MALFQRADLTRIREPIPGRRAITQKDLPEIKKGDRFEYRGRNTPTYCALYDAEVVQVTAHTVTMALTIDQAYLDVIKLGAARSFRWTISKTDIGSSEILFTRE